MRNRRLSIFLIMIVLSLVLYACAPPVRPTENPNQPVSSDDPTVVPTELPPASEVEIREGANVSDIQVNIMESFPLQVSVTVAGSLPDACTTIREIETEREGNTFQITILTQRPLDKMCAQVLAPFEANVALDVYGLPAGNYTVEVYDQTAEFTFTQDNAIPDD